MGVCRVRSLLFIIHDPVRASMGEWRHRKHPYGVGRRVIGSAPSVSVKLKHVERRLCDTTRLLHIITTHGSFRMTTIANVTNTMQEILTTTVGEAAHAP